MNKYKLVPVEPTESMLRSAMQYDAVQDPADPNGNADALRTDWRLMLAAAPAVQWDPVGYPPTVDCEDCGADGLIWHENGSYAGVCATCRGDGQVAAAEPANQGPVMKAHKPEVVAIKDSDVGGLIELNPVSRLPHGARLIRLSDYEALQTECRRLLSEATYSMVHNPVCQREAHGPCMCRDCVLARIGPFVASIQEASQ